MIGLTPSQFWDLTPRELGNAIEGYKKREVEEWKRTRFIAYTVATYAGKQMKHHIPIERWYPLPGDEVPPMRIAKVTKLTKEEIRERYRKAGMKIKDEQLEKALHRRGKKNDEALKKLKRHGAKDGV